MVGWTYTVTGCGKVVKVIKNFNSVARNNTSWIAIETILEQGM